MSGVEDVVYRVRNIRKPVRPPGSAYSGRSRAGRRQGHGAPVGTRHDKRSRAEHPVKRRGLSAGTAIEYGVRCAHDELALRGKIDHYRRVDGASIAKHDMPAVRAVHTNELVTGVLSMRARRFPRPCHHRD